MSSILAQVSMDATKSNVAKIVTVVAAVAEEMDFSFNRDRGRASCTFATTREQAQKVKKGLEAKGFQVRLQIW